jgi:hypothetical protein
LSQLSYSFVDPPRSPHELLSHRTSFHIIDQHFNVRNSKNRLVFALRAY